MASFENESTAMKFSLTVDDSKKTVTMSKISPNAEADNLDGVADSLKPLFEVTPTKVRRYSVDEIVK